GDSFIGRFKAITTSRGSEKSDDRFAECLVMQARLVGIDARATRSGRNRRAKLTFQAPQESLKCSKMGTHLGHLVAEIDHRAFFGKDPHGKSRKDLSRDRRAIGLAYSDRGLEEAVEHARVCGHVV